MQQRCSKFKKINEAKKYTFRYKNNSNIFTVPKQRRIYLKRFSFIFFLFICLIAFGDATDYMCGGVLIPFNFTNSDNINPAYNQLHNYFFSFSITDDFSTAKRYSGGIKLNFKLSEYLFSIKYVKTLESSSNIKFSFSGKLSKSFLYGIVFKNYFSDENRYSFDAGIFVDRKDYFYGLSVVNIGGLNIDNSFLGQFQNKIFPSILEPGLYFADDEEQKLKEGIITNFIISKNNRFYMGIQINSFVSSIDDIKNFGWENILYGILYRLPDGSFFGFGENARFNSVGIGYTIKQLTFSYSFLWQPKRFNYHFCSVKVIL